MLAPDQFDNGLRQWCETCQRFTRTITWANRENECGEHEPEYDDEDE